MIARTIFECEHCHRKRLMNKTQMKKHEETCYHNPNGKSCITCGNFESEAPYREYHDEIPGGAYEYIDGYRDCKAKLNIKDKLKTNCNLWIRAQIEIEEEIRDID